MSREFNCPTVRLELTAFCEFFGDVTATIDGDEEIRGEGMQEVRRLVVEYQEKRIEFAANALRDIGAVSMASWYIREERGGRLPEPTLCLVAENPVVLANGKRVKRVIECAIEQGKLRRITFEIPQSEHAVQFNRVEY